SSYVVYHASSTTEIYTLSLHDALPISLLGSYCVGMKGSTSFHAGSKLTPSMRMASWIRASGMTPCPWAVVQGGTPSPISRQAIRQIDRGKESTTAGVISAEHGHHPRGRSEDG